LGRRGGRAAHGERPGPRRPVGGAASPRGTRARGDRALTVAELAVARSSIPLARGHSRTGFLNESPGVESFAREGRYAARATVAGVGDTARRGDRSWRHGDGDPDQGAALGHDGDRRPKYV